MWTRRSPSSWAPCTSSWSRGRPRRCASPGRSLPFMFHLKSSPPVGPLLDAVRRLEGAGLVVALGGSGLLAALGLESEARDWDLTTDAMPDDVAARFAGITIERVGPGGIHADHKVQLEGGAL